MGSMPVSQLARWLEAQGVDVATACNGDQVLATLWQKIEDWRPPALASIEGPAGLRDWPLAHQLLWLEHLGGLDEALCSKVRLVQLVLEREKEPPPPPATPEMSEATSIAQVAHNLGTVKQVVTMLLSILSSAEMQQVMALEWKKYAWAPNGMIVKAFQRPAQGAEGEAEGFSILDVVEGEHVDAEVDYTSDWAWCRLDGGARQGWVPRLCVVEVARALEDYAPQEGEQDAMAMSMGQQLQVLHRHDNGWTMVRTTGQPKGGEEQEDQHGGSNGSPPESQEGWVPDDFLTDHPRNRDQKQHRVVLAELTRINQKATDIEKGCQLAQLAELEGGSGQLHSRARAAALQDMVNVLIEEYHAVYRIAASKAEKAAALHVELNQGRLAPELVALSEEQPAAPSSLPPEMPVVVVTPDLAQRKPTFAGEEGPAELEEQLAELARDSDEDVREAAFRTLLAFCVGGDPELATRAMNLLTELAKDSNERVRAAACIALGASCERGGPELVARAAALLAGLAEAEAERKAEAELNVEAERKAEAERSAEAERKAEANREDDEYWAKEVAETTAGSQAIREEETAEIAVPLEPLKPRRQTQRREDGAARVLQRAARGLLARRRLRPARLQERPASLVAGEGLDLATEGDPWQRDARWSGASLQVAEAAEATRGHLGAGRGAVPRVQEATAPPPGVRAAAGARRPASDASESPPVAQLPPTRRELVEAQEWRAPGKSVRLTSSLGRSISQAHVGPTASLGRSTLQAREGRTREPTAASPDQSRRPSRRSSLPALSRDSDDHDELPSWRRKIDAIDDKLAAIESAIRRASPGTAMRKTLADPCVSLPTSKLHVSPLRRSMALVSRSSRQSGWHARPGDVDDEGRPAPQGHPVRTRGRCGVGHLQTGAGSMRLLGKPPAVGKMRSCPPGPAAEPELVGNTRTSPPGPISGPIPRPAHADARAADPDMVGKTRTCAPVLRN